MEIGVPAEQVIQQAVSFVITEDSSSNIVHFTPVVFGDQRGTGLTSSAAILGGNGVLVDVEGFTLHQQLVPRLFLIRL